MATTQVELVVPSGILYSGQAQMVVCRTSGGDIAFLADHMPYVGLVEPGTLRIVGPVLEATAGGLQGRPERQGPAERQVDELRFDVEDGLVEVKDNRVVVACTAAERAG
ncbi:MAG: F0F1 ATP synthase subunit epsilon [Acidimicrobiales bacterium]